MDTTSRDVLILIMKELDLCSLGRLACVSKRYQLYARDDSVWRKLLDFEFGAVGKEDIIPPATSNYELYKAFHRALMGVFRHDSDTYQEGMRYQFEHRKPRQIEKYTTMPHYEALLFRRPDKSMIVPIAALWIRPRIGDTILDPRTYKFVNTAIVLWNGKNFLKAQNDVINAIPADFAYPDFPLGYFKHDDCFQINIRITTKIFAELTEKRQITIKGGPPLLWNLPKYAEIGDVYIFWWSMGERYYRNTLKFVHAISKCWIPTDPEDADWLLASRSWE